MATRSTLEAMALAFDRATCAEDVFGALKGTSSEKTVALKVQLRHFAKLCHPDNAPTEDKSLATRAFQSLSKWEASARHKIESGTYGDKQSGFSTAPYTPVELLIRGKTLTLTGLIAEGVFAGVHRARLEGETQGALFVKHARDARDNDLLQREFSVLKALHSPDADPQSEAFFASQRAYVPCPVSSFSILDEHNIKHRANLLRVPDARAYTAQTLRQDKFPAGIEPKHVWWIFRRLLLTLWMAHLKGFIHGSVTPDHLLVFPEEHGLVLLDWTCAAKIGEEHVPAINPAFRDYYPPELARKEAAMPPADLFMAASTAIWMLGGNPAAHRIPDTVPDALKHALLRCLDPVARRRPQDAEAFHNEFGVLLGHRVFAPMVIP